MTFIDEVSDAELPVLVARWMQSHWGASTEARVASRLGEEIGLYVDARKVKAVLEALRERGVIGRTRARAAAGHLTGRNIYFVASQLPARGEGRARFFRAGLDEGPHSPQRAQSGGRVGETARDWREELAP